MHLQVVFRLISDQVIEIVEGKYFSALSPAIFNAQKRYVRKKISKASKSVSSQIRSRNVAKAEIKVLLSEREIYSECMEQYNELRVQKNFSNRIPVSNDIKISKIHK